MNQNKAFTSLKIIIPVACLLSGLLAGENVFRYVMEVPGWRHIDIKNWGEYSRNADLKGGAFILPFEAIVGTILLIASSVIIIKNKNKFNSPVLTLHLATIFSITGLGLTFLAALYMLSVRTMGDDPVLLKQTFDHFHFWGLLRAIAQVLSFFFCVFGIGKMFELKLK